MQVTMSAGINGAASWSRRRTISRRQEKHRKQVSGIGQERRKLIICVKSKPARGRYMDAKTVFSFHRRIGIYKKNVNHSESNSALAKPLTKTSCVKASGRNTEKDGECRRHRYDHKTQYAHAGYKFTYITCRPEKREALAGPQRNNSAWFYKAR